MKALVTGASSGIGRSFAYLLAGMGYDLILVARRKKRLIAIKDSVDVNVKIFDMDISTTFNCHKLYNKVKKENIDIVINAAGFGLIGEFTETSLERELDMIDLNVKSLHTLTKLFLSDFVKKDKGSILNVASIAAFQPGPLMATYYSTKSYVYNLTLSIYGELKKQKSNVHISCLCPGPVETNFNNVANCEFSVKGLSSEYVANYAINKMLKNKLLIIPGFSIKLLYIFGRLMPIRSKLNLTYNIQHAKRNN